MSQLHIAYFSFGRLANVTKIRKQNVNLFVLSVIAYMFTMKLIRYADGLSYRGLETYGGILGYRGLHKTGAMQKSYYISLLSNIYSPKVLVNYPGSDGSVPI